MVPVEGGEVWAEDSEGPAPPVVLLHPGWGDSRIWQPVVDRLGKQARTIRYDVRGYHRSPAPQCPFTQLGDLRAVLDKLAVPPAIVVGHSGGGGTAIGLALAEPARVRGLVLLAPGLHDYPWPADDPFFTRFREALAAGDKDTMAKLGLRTWARGDHDPVVRRQIHSATEAFFASGAHEQPDPPAFGRLAEIAAPSSLLIGDRDHPMLVQCAHAIAGRIPGCRIVTVPYADHMLPLRAPDLIADLITGHTSSRRDRR